MEEEQKDFKPEEQEVTSPAKKKSEAQGPSNGGKPVYRPVVCPRCGSVHLEFVSECHKSIGLRVISVILLAVCIMLAVASIATPDAIFPPELIAVFIAFYLLFQIAAWARESRTHVQGVCRDCGFIWLLD